MVKNTSYSESFGLTWILDAKYHKNMLLILAHLVAYFNHCRYSEVAAGMLDSKYLTALYHAMWRCRAQIEEEYHIQSKWQRNAVDRM